MTTTQTKSKLAQQLEARKPQRKGYDVDALPGIDNAQIVFEIPRNSMTTRALTLALQMRDEDTTGNGEGGKKYPHHPAIVDHKAHFENLHTIATLYLVSRDAEDPDGRPAFPSARWMRENFHNYEIEYLTKLYNRFVGEVYPGGIRHLESTEELVKFARTVAANWKNDLPDLEISKFSFEVLVECFIRMCVIWFDADRENTELRNEIDLYRSAGVKPTEDDAGPEGDTLSVYAVRLLAETATSSQGDIVSAAAHDIVTKQQAIVAMKMLGWKETSPSWSRVIAN